MRSSKFNTIVINKCEKDAFQIACELDTIPEARLIFQFEDPNVARDYLSRSENFSDFNYLIIADLNTITEKCPRFLDNIENTEVLKSARSQFTFITPKNHSGGYKINSSADLGLQLISEENFYKNLKKTIVELAKITGDL